MEVIKSYTFFTTEFTNVSVSDTTTTVDNERFYKLEYKPLVELGLTNDVTVGIAPSLQNVTSSSSSNGVNNNFGLTEIDFHFRYKLFDKDASVFSIQPLVKLSGIFDETARPSLGQRQNDVEIRALYGHAFKLNNAWHFINAEGAYRKRFENPSDEYRADLTIGYKLTPKITVMPQLFATYAADRSTEADRIATNSNDFDLVKFQLSFVKEIKPGISFQLGAFTHAYASNTGDGVGTVFSFWRSF